MNEHNDQLDDIIDRLDYITTGLKVICVCLGVILGLAIINAIQL